MARDPLVGGSPPAAGPGRTLADAPDPPAGAYVSSRKRAVGLGERPLGERLDGVLEGVQGADVAVEEHQVQRR